MADTGLTVPGMTELPRFYDVTITVDRDGGDHLNPAGFAVAADVRIDRGQRQGRTSQNT